MGKFSMNRKVVQYQVNSQIKSKSSCKYEKEYQMGKLLYGLEHFTRAKLKLFQVR